MDFSYDNSSLGPRVLDPPTWDSIKGVVRRIYIEENVSLEATCTQIQEETGFHASESSWKRKLSEWGFVKNLPAPAWDYLLYKEAELEQEGKATVFYYGGIEVTKEKIDKEKTRRGRVVLHLLNLALPRHLEHETPFLKCERGTHRPKRTSSSSLLPLDADGEEADAARTHKSGLPSHEFFDSFDDWLWNKARPWSHGDLSYQLVDHNASTPGDGSLPAFEKARDIGFLLGTRDDSLNLFCAGIGSFADCKPAIESKKGDTDHTSLDKFFSIVGYLPELRSHHRGYTAQQLSIHFELAKTLAAAWRLEEALHICHMINTESQEIVVQALLGMCLAGTNHLQESAEWFIIALTKTIVTFGNHMSESHFDPIYELFNELAYRNEKRWTSMIECWQAMRETIGQMTSDEDIPGIYSQLLIHGFSIAYQCSLLGMNNSAKYLYQHLLGHTTFDFEFNRNALEKGIAHQRYGLLLKNEKQWTASADQLLLACEYVIKSGSNSQKLVAGLTMHYDHLRPHLATGSIQKDTLAKALKLMLDWALYQISTSKSLHVSRLEYYYESDLPRTYAVFEPKALSLPMATFTLPVRTSVPSAVSQQDVYLNSTAVMSEVLRMVPNLSVRGSTEEDGNNAMECDDINEDGCICLFPDV